MSDPTATNERALAVFGATGTTGGYVIQQALDAGLSVRALARSPGKLSKELSAHERVEVMEADATDLVAVSRGVEGVGMVFAALGYKGTPERPILLPFTQNVVRAMRQHGATRLVYQASALNQVPGQPNPLPVRVLRPIIGWTLRTNPLWHEHDAVIRFLVEEVDDLEWTVPRPGRLLDEPSKGTLVAAQASGGAVAYRDVATFSLEALRSGSHARASPYLAYATAD